MASFAGRAVVRLQISLVLAVGCSFDVSRDIGRPCSDSSDCRGKTVCDLAQGRCLLAPADVDGAADVGATDLSGRDGSAPLDSSRDSDGLPRVDAGPSCTPGICRACGPSGPQLPVDDPACGTIDCDGKDEFFVKGSASPGGVNYRYKRDYHDLTAARCKALGICKTPNSDDCTEVVESKIDTCGTCQRATTQGCEAYPDYTSCEDTFANCDDRCFGGTCAWRLYLHNNGTASCAEVCSWDGDTCHGAYTDSGAVVGCGVKEPSDCYCTGTINCQ